MIWSFKNGFNSNDLPTLLPSLEDLKTDFKGKGNEKSFLV